MEVTDRVRAEGAGDKPAIEKQPGLWDADRQTGFANNPWPSDVDVAVDIEVDLRAFT
ncbi:MAG: hypothetical protein IPN02_05960 [Candidatus Microthrix sp.]|uniref:Uncharacterized protein n=1 Tax=Candidatus Neomicrothrix subdominans TaxID=2954438 RepID=A0A936TE75_9ACTN|nr:hypothetical protein [Candidatus Microthrix subdominans]